jgi:hypothetical protein
LRRPSIILYTFSGCGRTKIKHANHKTIGMGNENGLAGYGFEKSSFGCCASRQPKENYKGCQSQGSVGEGFRLRVGVRVRVRVGV